MKIKCTLFKTEWNLNEFLLLTKIKEEIYRVVFNCMEIIPAANKLKLRDDEVSQLCCLHLLSEYYFNEK